MLGLLGNVLDAHNGFPHSPVTVSHENPVVIGHDLPARDGGVTKSVQVAPSRVVKSSIISPLRKSPRATTASPALRLSSGRICERRKQAISSALAVTASSRKIAIHFIRQTQQRHRWWSWRGRAFYSPAPATMSFSSTTPDTASMSLCRAAYLSRMT